MRRGRPQKGLLRHLTGEALWKDGYRQGEQDMQARERDEGPDPHPGDAWHRREVSGLTREAMDFAGLLAEFVVGHETRSTQDEYALLERARKALIRHAHPVLAAEQDRLRAKAVEVIKRRENLL